MGAELVAELNDLLQLDHDALQAYSLAIGRLRSAEYRETLAGFRDDHQRHIDELTPLIRERGAVPVELPHVPTGPFKLAVQALAAAGGDRALLLAFKTNEGQVRDKYRRAAERRHPAEVEEIVRRAADDEERHYRWVEETLRALGAGPETVTGQVQQAVETVHARAADVVEKAGRKVAEAVERARSGGEGAA